MPLAYCTCLCHFQRATCYMQLFMPRAQISCICHLRTLRNLRNNTIYRSKTHSKLCPNYVLKKRCLEGAFIIFPPYNIKIDNKHDCMHPLPLCTYLITGMNKTENHSISQSNEGQISLSDYCQLAQLSLCLFWFFFQFLSTIYLYVIKTYILITLFTLICHCLER